MGTGRPAETQNHSRSVSLLNIGAASIFANTRLERKEEVSGLFMDARTNKKKKKMSLLGNIFVSSCFFFFFSCCIREKNFLDVKENENMGGGGLKGNRLQQKWGEEKDSLIEIPAKNEADLNWL